MSDRPEPGPWSEIKTGLLDIARTAYRIINPDTSERFTREQEAIIVKAVNESIADWKIRIK